MRATQVGPLALLATYSLWASAAPIDQATARKELQSQYAIFAEAERKSDVKTVISMTTPDFTFHTIDGRTMNRQQYEAYASQRAARNRKANAQWKMNTKVAVAIGQIRLQGDRAIVQATLNMTGTAVNKMGVRYTSRTSIADRHTWIRTGAGWKLKRSTQERYTTTSDFVAPPSNQ